MSFVHRTFRLPLTPSTDLAGLLRTVADADACEIFRHDWSPHGATIVQVHKSATFILHTWPERAFCTLDVIALEIGQTPSENDEAEFGEG